MKKILILNSLIVSVLILCSGCASIVTVFDSGGKKRVHLDSNPPGAKVTVWNGGQQVTSATTPAVVKLPRGDGYFRGARYTVKYELPGYYPYETELHPVLNGWYIGNIAIGGLIGLVAVDPVTGAMWTLSPGKIDRNLISTSQNLTPEQLKAAEAEANPTHKASSDAGSKKY